MPELLATYPRVRPPLGPAHRAVYQRELELNRGGKTWLTRLSTGLEGWMHRAVARRGRPGSVLELGGGTLNHLPYEPAASAYDVVEPNEALRRGSPHAARVRSFYKDVAELPETARYDRIVSVAVLEHVERLPELLARAALHLAPGGVFQAGIPSEGGLAWGLSWRLSTGLAYRLRNGLPYGPLMRFEHVNDAEEIVALAGWFFSGVRVSRFPLPLHHLSVYAYVEADGPKLERCRAYLDGLRPGARR